MRIIHSLDDVQKVINEILDWKSLISTKDWDFHQLKITNAADGVAPRDYVTVEQLKDSKTTEKDITKVINNNQQDQYYTIGFSKDGTVATGENSPPWIIGNRREGIPSQVWLACNVAPTTAALSINFDVTSINPVDNTETTVSLLASDLSIPIGSTRRVFTQVFSASMPNFANGVKINKKITSDGGAAFVSMGIIVKRIL